MNTKFIRRLLGIFLSLYMGLSVPPVQSKEAPEGEKLYRLGLFFYNNDDISDKAVEYLQQVIEKFPDSPQAHNAQFYIARYYERKFYIYREQKGEAQANILNEAVEAYQEFIQAYTDKSSPLLSDAHFYLGLVHLELGDTSAALSQFQIIKNTVAKTDSQVYVYQLLWSRDPVDIIDKYLDAVPLASEAERIFQGYEEPSFSLANSGALKELKNWCKGNKYYEQLYYHKQLKE